ncbi:MAG: undecaprenyl-diphosphate phosphatase [Lentisphaeria bacterium]|nr:undecaprenyl-diphosphate phosphatase [Lentisphaeria bacterium]
MQNWIRIIVMAAAQGLTEFLPVSSSGHLVVLGKLFGFDADTNLSLGIFMHAGSLFAIAVFYFKLLTGFLKKEQLHLLLMLVVGSIPAAAAGITLNLTGWGAKLFDDPLITGMAFLVTGALLRLTDRKKLVPDQEQAVAVRDVSLKQALIIGLVQMGAILPGISRSGSTISAGVLCGVKREDAAAFSFLLALPAIGGAALIELLSALRSADGATQVLPALQLISAVAVSFLFSMGALICVVSIVKKSRLSVFSWYLFALGIAVIVWQTATYNGVK